ncbi:MAG: phage tail assembly chaperone [Chlorobium sp.]|uniref:phage tail assembly chaperone n=1 Tax=Chlorobium sp. TaxID=1095 RepID=UPI002F41A1FA
MITINMPKARGIKRNQLRAERAPMLSALDVEYQQADERKSTTAKKDIAQRKQALRDVTKHPAIEAATTPDDLKSLSIDNLIIT